MDKGLTVLKWVLINRPKIPQMPQNLSAQIVCSSPKVWYFDEKRLHWVSVVRATRQLCYDCLATSTRLPVTGDDKNYMKDKWYISIKTVHRTAEPKKKIFTMAEVLHILQTHKKEGG